VLLFDFRFACRCKLRLARCCQFLLLPWSRFLMLSWLGVGLLSGLEALSARRRPESRFPLACSAPGQILVLAPSDFSFSLSFVFSSEQKCADPFASACAPGYFSGFEFAASCGVRALASIWFLKPSVSLVRSFLLARPAPCPILFAVACFCRLAIFSSRSADLHAPWFSLRANAHRTVFFRDEDSSFALFFRLLCDLVVHVAIHFLLLYRSRVIGLKNSSFSRFFWVSLVIYL
jgi:hypothetical protein